MWYSYGGLKAGDIILINGDFTSRIKELKEAKQYFDRSKEINDSINNKKEYKAGNTTHKSSPIVRKQSEQPAQKMTQTSAGAKSQKNNPQVVLPSQIARNITNKSAKYIKNTDSDKYNNGMEIIGAAQQREYELIKNMTTENAVEIFASYRQLNNHSLMNDLIQLIDKDGKTVAQEDRDNELGKGKTKAGDKKIISLNLRTSLDMTLLERARKLYIKTIDYDKIYDIENVNEFSKYIDDIVNKIDAVEKERKALKVTNDVSKIIKEVKTQRDFYGWKRDQKTGKMSQPYVIPAPQAREQKLFKKMNKENAAFIVMKYAEINKYSIIEDLTYTVDNNGKVVSNDELTLDKQKYVNAKQIIGQNTRRAFNATLIARAKELNIKGVDFNKVNTIQNPKEFSDFIDDVASKVTQAEIKKMPQYNNKINANAAKYKKYDIEELEDIGKKFAEDLQKTIYHLPGKRALKFWTKEGFDDLFGNFKSEKTKSQIKSFTPENTAFVIKAYKEITGNTLVKDLMDEFGINADNIKKAICEPLAKQAKSLGITINENDYKFPINAYSISKWVEDTSEKVRAKMLERKGEHKVIPDKGIIGPKKDGTTLIPAGNIDIGATKSRTVTPVQLTQKDIDDGIVKIEDYFDNSGKKLYRIYYRKDKNKIIKEKELDCKIETVKNKDIFKKAGIIKAENFYKDNQKVSTVYYYEDGRVVQDYDKMVDGKKLHYRRLMRGQVQSFKKNKPPIFTPLKIQISVKLSDDIKDNKDVIERANAFAKTLETQKAYLMNTMNNLSIKLYDKNGKLKDPDYRVKIDNDDYNEFATLALSLAEHETQFGTNIRTGLLRDGKYNFSQVGHKYYNTLKNIHIPQTVYYNPNHEVKEQTNVYDAVYTTGAYLKGTAWSLGYTQIKYDDHIKSPEVKAIFDKLGITRENIYTPEKCALATVALLAVFNQRLNENPNYKSAITAAQGAVVEYENYELDKDGNAKKTYNTKPWINKITRNNVLCYFWNSHSTLLRGDAEPAASNYIRSINKISKNYTITETEPTVREEKIKESYDTNFTPNSNNGSIGSIWFEKGRIISKESKELFKKNTEHLPINLQNKLIEVFNKGNFIFRYGMTEAEIKSITKEDAELLIKYSAYPNTAQATKEFKREYLLLHSKRIPKKYADKNKVVQLKSQRLLNNSFSPVSRRNDLGVYTSVGIVKYNDKDGWHTMNINGEKEKVDISKLSPEDLLAIRAQRTAWLHNNGGECFQYWRRSMIDSGVDAALSPTQAADIVRCGKYKVGLGSSSTIAIDYPLKEGEKFVNKSQKDRNGKEIYYLDFFTAKESPKWFENHSEMFTEVQWVVDEKDINSVRQITAADLPNLPAGYIVVWIPGKNSKNYATQQGHICITGGNGLAYADEIDHLAWGDFNHYNRKTGEPLNDHGKGEHGTFRVYKLTDKWKVNPESGRLFFAG